MTSRPAHFLSNRRLRLVFLGLITLLVLGIIVTYKCSNRGSDPAKSLRCFVDSEPSEAAHGLEPLGDVLLTAPQPLPGRNIFFLETSCSTAQSRPSVVQLTARQACAIESAALHNPNFQVFVLFARPTYRSQDNSSKEQQPLIDAILSYKNVQLRQLNLWRFAAGTPIEEWLKDSELFSSSYLVNHISDLLRLIALYRFGGIYLDMDVVLLRSMEDVPLNYVGAGTDHNLNNGVMSMASTGIGHKIAESSLRDFQQNFDGSDWGNNGPGVITRVAETICDTKDISLMLDDRKRCQGFNVFNRNAFYAVPWPEWRHFFEPQYLEQTMAKTKDSYLVHVWNKHSQQQAIKVGSSTAYGKYAEKHCPKSYAAAGDYF